MGTVNGGCGRYCELLFPLKGEHSISQLYTRRRTVKIQIHSVSQLVLTAAAPHAVSASCPRRTVVNPIRMDFMGGKHETATG